MRMGGRILFSLLPGVVTLPLMAQITLDHFALRGTATIETLNAGFLGEGNSADDPMRVIPRRSAQELQGDVLRHVFPHESVTVIRFQRKK